MNVVNICRFVVGYGHITPKTIVGKLACMTYAMIGIPLNIVMFQCVGERFNVTLSQQIAKFKRCIFRGSDRSVTAGDMEISIAGLTMCTLVILFGALIFAYCESWSYIDGVYFCFITMSTIGFGDYVALQADGESALQEQPVYVIFTLLYILCGLAVFAAYLNHMIIRAMTGSSSTESKHEEPTSNPEHKNLTHAEEADFKERETLLFSAQDEVIRRNYRQSIPLSDIQINNKNTHSPTLPTTSTKSPTPTQIRAQLRRKNKRHHTHRYSVRLKPCLSVKHLMSEYNDRGDNFQYTDLAVSEPPPLAATRSVLLSLPNADRGNSDQHVYHIEDGIT